MTDEAWKQTAPLLTENGERVKQRRDHRTVVNVILWKLLTVPLARPALPLRPLADLLRPVLALADV